MGVNVLKHRRRAKSVAPVSKRLRLGFLPPIGGHNPNNIIYLKLFCRHWANAPSVNSHHSIVVFIKPERMPYKLVDPEQMPHKSLKLYWRPRCIHSESLSRHWANAPHIAVVSLCCDVGWLSNMSTHLFGIIVLFQWNKVGDPGPLPDMPIFVILAQKDRSQSISPLFRG